MAVLLFLVLNFALPSRADDGLPATVGDFSDPNRLVFDGETPFSSAQLHRAVETDLQLQLAGAPSASLADYLSLLKSRLFQGFRRCGFDQPDIVVRADAASGKVVVTLNPGHRYKCGQVVVTGANTVSADLLIKRLTEPSPATLFQTTVTDQQISVSSEQSPQSTSSSREREWTVGEPAPFDDYSAAQLTQFVRWQLAGMGYLHPFLRVYVEPGETDAKLVVRLIDEGPRATLNSIDFATLRRNAPEDVRAFLKIAPGDPVDLDRISEMQRKLWESGRVLRDTISVERIPNDLTHVNLHVKIDEAEGVPLLTEPLPEVDEAMLRFRKWCLSAGDNGDDVVVDVTDPDYHAKVVWGGTRGFTARISFAALQVNSSPAWANFSAILGEDRDIGVAITKTATGIYVPSAGIKCEGHFDPSMLTVSAGYAVNQDFDSSQPFCLSLSGNIDQSGDAAGTPGAIHCVRSFAPVAFLSLQGGYKWNAKIEGSVLVVEGNSMVMHIDSSSGRLLDATTIGPAGERSVKCTVEHDALNAMVKTLQAVPCANTNQTGKPLSAFIGMATAMCCHSGAIATDQTPQQRRKLAQIVGEILDANLLGHADAVFDSLYEPAGTDPFFLPIDADLSQPGGWTGMAAAFGLRVNGRLFAPRSWPATLARCFCLYLIDRGDAVGPEMNRLCSDPDTGPLACLILAELFHPDFPLPSQTFARHGLEKLSADMFAKDCAALFNSNPQTTAIALQLADNLRQLSDADVQALAGQLLPKSATPLQAMMSELRGHKGPSTAEFINSALNEAWKAGLRDAFESELNRLASQQ